MPRSAGDDDRHSAGGYLTWDDLPESAQAAAIAVAARALSSVPENRLPAMLRPVARFTPRKRAHRGATPLAKALAADSGFRALVAQHLPAGFGQRSSVGLGGESGSTEAAGSARTTGSADPGDAARAAARAFLLHLPDSGDLLAEAVRADEYEELRAQVAELTAELESLAARRAESMVQPPSTTQRQVSDNDDRHEADRAEIAKLKRRLRDQGTRVKAAETRAETAAKEVEEIRTRADARLEAAAQDVAKWREIAERQQRRAAAAQTALEAARNGAGQAAADADRRMELLLNTLTRAAVGLEHQWRARTGGSDPADLVAARLPAIPPRPSRVDRTVLLEWLRLPEAHLIIDGYNVTKTGYAQLPLSDQRSRLIRSLAPLSARTGAEITVVFDGADVVTPSASTSRVRVMFSPAGVLADDVIRDLVAAEPVGRVVIVVTSDREVVESVRAHGARSAPSALFLDVLRT